MLAESFKFSAFIAVSGQSRPWRTGNTSTEGLIHPPAISLQRSAYSDHQYWPSSSNSQPCSAVGEQCQPCGLGNTSYEQAVCPTAIYAPAITNAGQVLSIRSLALLSVVNVDLTGQVQLSQAIDLPSSDLPSRDRQCWPISSNPQPCSAMGGQSRRQGTPLASKRYILQRSALQRLPILAKSLQSSVSFCYRWAGSTLRDS